MIIVMTAGCVQGALTGSDALSIIEKERFKIVDQVSQIPLQPLISAKIIPPTRRLNTFIVDKNREFQHGDDHVDLSRPQRQIIFAGISPHYLFLCFWRSGQIESRYLMLLKLRGPDAEVIFYSTLDGQVKNLSDMKQLLRRNKISTLTFDSNRERE